MSKFNNVLDKYVKKEVLKIKNELNNHQKIDVSAFTNIPAFMKNISDK